MWKISVLDEPVLDQPVWDVLVGLYASLVDCDVIRGCSCLRVVDADVVEADIVHCFALTHVTRRIDAYYL